MRFHCHFTCPAVVCNGGEGRTRLDEFPDVCVPTTVLDEPEHLPSFMLRCYGMGFLIGTMCSDFFFRRFVNRDFRDTERRAPRTGIIPAAGKSMLHRSQAPFRTVQYGSADEFGVSAFHRFAQACADAPATSTQARCCPGTYLDSMN
jgi:hypothetical protein